MQEPDATLPGSHRGGDQGRRWDTGEGYGTAAVSMDRIRATMLKAWAKLNGAAERQRRDPPRAGRPRDPGTPVPPSEAGVLGKPGFAEEALPWMDAVHRFAQRLTRDPTEAEDLVQETYLRAYRSWDQFTQGSSCRSWLFTICRNTHLHQRDRASSRYEVVETDAAGHSPSRSLLDQRALASQSPDDFFQQIIDARLLAAIDALPGDFREVLILSDLADLNYAEISEVLEIPAGTVKSRLFRARRQLRQALLVHGVASAYADDRPGSDRGSR
jgi:RNA polymerase sigma-70 factor, ECF subfamily